jgi:hypothetical protein
VEFAFYNEPKQVNLPQLINSSPLYPSDSFSATPQPIHYLLRYVFLPLSGMSRVKATAMSITDEELKILKTKAVDAKGLAYCMCDIPLQQISIVHPPLCY